MLVLRLPDSWSNWNLEMLVFEEGKTGVPREKPLGARERTNIKLNLYMASTPGFEPRPHWWEASALITAPRCFPKRKKRNKPLKSIDLVKRKFTAIKQFKIQPFRRVRVSFRSRWVFLRPSQDEEVKWASFPIRSHDAYCYIQFQTCNLKLYLCYKCWQE